MNPPPDAATGILDMIRPLSAFTVGMTDIIDDLFGTHDAGDAEILAIVALIRADAIATTELRQRSGLSRRAHDRLVDRLVGNELIEQAPARHDRRVQLLTLTRRGRNRARDLEQRLTDYFTNSGDLANDILARLGESAPSDDDASCEPSDPLDFVQRMSSLGHTLDAAIRAHRAPKHPKNRDQIALLLIATGDCTRPSQLADELTLTAGGMTRVLDQLEADRLIARNHGRIPGDRRAVIIELTPDGREVIDAIAAGLTAIKPELRQLFSPIAGYARMSAVPDRRTAAPAGRPDQRD